MNTILVLISSNWAELEWILPVLFQIRNKSDHKIAVIFSSENLYQKKSDYTELFSLLNEVADQIIHPSRKELTSEKSFFERGIDYLKRKSGTSKAKKKAEEIYIESVFKKLLNPSKIKCILKDASADFSFKELIQDKCKNAKLVNYPHATTIHFDHQSNSDLSKIPAEILKKNFNMRSDLMLVHTRYDKSWWSKRVDIKKIEAVGFPRYEQDWIKRLTKEQDSKSLKNTILFVARGAHDAYLPSASFKELMKDMIKTMKDFPSIYFIIKPHPAQDLNELNSFLKEIPETQYEINYDPAAILANRSDLIVSVFSSCILDSLSVKKPVIEFFRYEVEPEINQEYIKENNIVTGVYRKLGLCVPADKYQDLHNLIKEFFDQKNMSIFNNSIENFKALMNEYSDSSKRAADLILE